MFPFQTVYDITPTQPDDAGCSVGDSYHFGCLRTLSRSTEIIARSIIRRCERKKRPKCFAVVFFFIKHKHQHTHTHIT